MPDSTKKYYLSPEGDSVVNLEKLLAAQLAFDGNQLRRVLVLHMAECGPVTFVYPNEQAACIALENICRILFDNKKLKLDFNTQKLINH